MQATRQAPAPTARRDELLKEAAGYEAVAEAAAPAEEEAAPAAAEDDEEVADLSDDLADDEDEEDDEDPEEDVSESLLLDSTSEGNISDILWKRATNIRST
jgi:hypothetical protein